MKHLAIIADGNRRWAKERELPQSWGYGQGLICIENLCELVMDKGIKYFSVFCFSTENWNRTSEEIGGLFDLARAYLVEKKEWYKNKNIKVVFRGNKSKLPSDLFASLVDIEEYTKNCTALTLQIMISYGGRQDIVDAIKAGALTEEQITKYFNDMAPEPDVIVRTGGRTRLSNFMLWQAAYSELLFVDTLFPDFGEQELKAILDEYNTVQKNYGK